MRVYYESVVEKICKMKEEFENDNGYAPNHVELSFVEYSKLVDELNSKYLLKNRLMKYDESGTKTFLGLILKIEDSA